MSETDTPINSTIKPASSRSVSTSVSNEDLMTTLKSFKADMLASNKAISNIQATHYQDLKIGLSNLSIIKLLRLRPKTPYFVMELMLQKLKLLASTLHWPTTIGCQSSTPENL